MGGSGGLQDDAFDDVGDVFSLVDGGLDDFEDFFPLDDLDGIVLLMEELSDERAAEAVAIVFVAVDLDAVLERFLRFFERANSQFDFRGGRNQDLNEIEGSVADAIDAIEHKTAGGGIDQVDDVVEAAADLVNGLTVETGDEGLIYFGEEGVRDFVAFVLDGFYDLH